MGQHLEDGLPIIDAVQIVCVHVRQCHELLFHTCELKSLQCHDAALEQAGYS